MNNRAVILESFDNLRKQREELLKKFQDMQSIDNQKFVLESQQKQRDLEECNKRSKEGLPGNSPDGTFEDSNITADSTAISHILRCFSDLSQNSSIFSRNEVKSNIPKVISKKQKQPFLRKRSGLLRYKPKSVRQSEVPKSISSSKVQEPVPYSQFEVNLKSKQNLFNGASVVRGNHVRFKEPQFDVPDEETNFEAELSYLPEDINERYGTENKDLNNLPGSASDKDILENNREIKIKNPIIEAVKGDDIFNQEPIPCFQFEINVQSKRNIVSGASIFQESHPHFKEREFDVPEEESFETEASSVRDKDIIEPDRKIKDRNPIQTVKGDDIFSQEKDNKELAEFELLENCAQNSSFNSDSSVVQRVLRGEPVNPPQSREKAPCPVDMQLQSKKSNAAEMPSPKANLFKFHEELLMKQRIQKQQIEDIIHDIDPRINTLQQEISRPHHEVFIENENDSNRRCSTPFAQNLLQTQLPASNPDCSTKSSSSSVICTSRKDDLILSDEDASSVDKFKKYEDLADNKDTLCSRPSSQDVSENISEKSILRKKIEELEKEIEIYQMHNARLSDICKEREEISRNLKKEYDGIEKYKEEQKKKIETEIENERRHLKRQKETFNRYQKLRKDNFSRKEREELTILRREVEKEQEERKREKIRLTNENRRLKNQLIAAEKERDALKLENITLEEQCQDLLSVLKSKNFKNRIPSLNVLSRSDEVEKISLHEATNSDKDILDNDSQNSTKKFFNKKSCDNGKINSALKPRVRFNLTPQFESGATEKSANELENFSCDKIETDVTSESSEHLNEDSGLEITNLSEFDEPIAKEIKHGDKVEKIHLSGDREIIFPSGTKKIISADEETIKIIFHNGDVKDIYPDKREIYRYANGVVEKCFPCGLQVTEFPNGQVERLLSDGLREVKFPDGTVHYINCDGSEEIVGIDGTIATLAADGTETVEYKNGEKEIRTATYKRREFPDGSVRILYNSGRQETRYSNGRIKIKDKNGKVIVDTKHLKGLKG